MERENYNNLLNACVSASDILLQEKEIITSIAESLRLIKNSLFFNDVNLYLFINIAPYYNASFDENIYGRLLKEELFFDEHLVYIGLRYQKELLGVLEFAVYNTLSNEIIQLLKLYSHSLTNALVIYKKEEDAKNYSYRDSLTNLYNRNYFNLVYKKRASSSESIPLSLIVADVNGLKLVNDSFGHAKGDLIIKTSANILLSEKREKSIISRWGGDEFIMLLPNTNEEEVKQIVFNILEKAQKTYLHFLPISISIASSTTYEQNYPFEKLFKEAEDLMYKQKSIESPIIKKKIIESIMQTLFNKYEKEKQHSENVSELCAQIGLAMNFDEYAVEILRIVGKYHDIGKIAINEAILEKQAKLTDLEYEEIKKHTDIGYRILSSVNEMSDIADYILKHHERIDGKGYPYGISGEEIPPFTKILSVAEAYDAMTSFTYRPPLTKSEAVLELINNSGTQFDPVIVRAFVEKVLKQPWYSVLYGVNNTVVEIGESFDPLKGVFVVDKTDVNLSVNDIVIIGEVNTKEAGNYYLIYSITNKDGKCERILRKVAVGNLQKLCEFNNCSWEKVEIDGAKFSYTVNNNIIDIDLINGGSNNWSAQIIKSGIILEKGKHYVLSFDAYTNVLRKEMHISIGWLNAENDYWHSFINTSENKFFITPYNQTYKLIFKMEKDTFLNTDLKFEFGTGKDIKINISNVKLYEFTS